MFVETFILSTQNISETVNLPTDFYYKIYVEMIGTGYTSATFEFSGRKFISHNPIITFHKPLLEGDNESLEQVDEFIDSVPKKEKEFDITPNNLPDYYGDHYGIVKVEMMNSGISPSTYNSDYIEFVYPNWFFNFESSEEYEMPIVGKYDHSPHNSSEFYYSDHPLLIRHSEVSWEQQRLSSNIVILNSHDFSNTICVPIDRSRVYNCHYYAWFLPIGPSTDSDVSIWSQNRTPRIWVKYC